LIALISGVCKAGFLQACCRKISASRMLFGIANNENSTSLASKLRLRRNQWFAELVEGIERPMSVLDVGGRDVVWQTIGFAGDPSVHITLANVEPTQTSYTNIRSVTADARDLNQFADGQFDVVYSNSVIEHVGDFEDMRRMANRAALSVSVFSVFATTCASDARALFLVGMDGALLHMGCCRARG
jgi:hypothetical protein